MVDLMGANAPATPEAERGSKTSLVYRRLRTDVLAGKFAPGERLKIADLAEALAVNAAAVREALQRLVSEQLVVSRDQKGFLVAPLSIEDLRELTELRAHVESLALRRSVEQGDFAWEANVLATAHHLRRTAMVSKTNNSFKAEWSRRHKAFHSALVAACDNRRLLALHTLLYEQCERYRLLTLRLALTHGLERDVDSEHQAIVDAAIERDADLVVRLVVDHFARTTDLIIDNAERSLIDLA